MLCLYRLTVCVHTLSHVLLFAMPWILARQAPLSVGLSWQEHWSRLPFPSSGDIPHLGIKPVSPVLAGEPLSTREAPLISCSVNMYPMYDGWMVPILPCWCHCALSVEGRGQRGRSKEGQGHEHGSTDLRARLAEEV